MICTQIFTEVKLTLITKRKKKKGKKMRTETKQMSLKFCITFKCATFEDFTHIHKQPMQHVAEVSYTCNLPQRGKIKKTESAFPSVIQRDTQFSLQILTWLWFKYFCTGEESKMRSVLRCSCGVVRMDKLTGKNTSVSKPIPCGPLKPSYSTMILTSYFG